MLSDWKKILTIRRFHQAGQFAARFFCNFKLLAHHYIARATLESGAYPRMASLLPKGMLWVDTGIYCGLG